MAKLAESHKHLPKMVIFDLDYTLWPFWVDTHMEPPFIKNHYGIVVDMRGKQIKYYPDAPKVLKYLHDKNINMSAASRTGEIYGAEQLIQLFEWNKYFKNKQIYPGSKVTHIKRISKDCAVKLKDILFFDDERRNIFDSENLGVVSILVKNGITMKVLMEGLRKFSHIKMYNY